MSDATTYYSKKGDTVSSIVNRCYYLSDEDRKTFSSANNSRKTLESEMARIIIDRDNLSVKPDTALTAGTEIHIAPSLLIPCTKKNEKGITILDGLIIEKKPDTSLIFYSPRRDEYLVIGEEDETEIDTFKELYKPYRDLSETVIRAREEKDAKKRLQKIDQAGKDIEYLFSSDDVDVENIVEELLLVKNNPRWGSMSRWVYIKPKQLKGRFKKGFRRKSTDATIKKKLDEWQMKKEAEKKSKKKSSTQKKDEFGFDASLEATLLQAEYSKQWPLKWRIASDKNPVAGTALENNLDISYEAQVCRFAAGCALKSDFDLKDRTFAFGVDGSVSYNLIEGKIEGDFYIPNKNGINLLTLLTGNDKLKDLIEANRQCNLRLKIVADSLAYVGASATASIALPNVDFSAKSKKKSSGSAPKATGPAKPSEPGIEAGGKAEAFAGAHAEVGISAIGQWNRSTALPFDDLGSVGYKLGVSAGVGAGAKISFEYTNGTFYGTVGAHAVLGIGGSGSTSVAIGVDQGFELLAHLLACVEYHHVYEIKSSAFEAIRAYAAAQLCNAGKIAGAAAVGAVESAKEISLWLLSIRPRIADVKRIIRMNIQDENKLKAAPPESQAQALLAIMETKEDDDYEAILNVLRAAKTEHEFKWILRKVSQMPLPPKEAPGYAEVSGKALKEAPGYAEVSGKALKEGIKRLFDFADYDNKEKSNISFISEFSDLLTDNKITFTY